MGRETTSLTPSSAHAIPRVLTWQVSPTCSLLGWQSPPTGDGHSACSLACQASQALSAPPTGVLRVPLHG